MDNTTEATEEDEEMDSTMLPTPNMAKVRLASHIFCPTYVQIGKLCVVVTHLYVIKPVVVPPLSR